MPQPRSVQEIRQANGGLGNMTDFEIAQYEYSRFKPYYGSFDDFARDTGFETGSKWGNRVSASIDNYQAGMLGVGEAITGSETLRGMRQRNELSARNSQQLAASQGAIGSYKDVNGVGDALDYVGGLAVDSAPYLGEAVIGGLATGGTSLAGTAARYGISRGALRAAGGALASYPSSMGDILQNQREQAGTTDVGAAALGAIPYAALNAVGLEGAAARGKLVRSGIDALDNMSGMKGAIARTGVAAAKNAVPEGLSEAGQEVINQYAGRMAVDPNATLTDPDAIERYKESFIGGAALGGVAGGALGGWRRSESYLPPGKTVDDGATDLLAGTNWTTSQGFEPTPQPVQPSPLGDLTPDWTTSQGFEDLQRPQGIDASGLYPAVDEPSLVPRGEQVAPSADRSLDMPGVSMAPETMPVDFMGNAAGTDQQIQQMNDPGAVEARRIWMERQQAEQAVLQQAEAKRQEIESMRKRAEEVGLKGDKAAEVLSDLDTARATGLITDGQFAENLGMLQARQFGQVRRFLVGIAETKKAQVVGDEQTKADAIAKVQARGKTDTASNLPTAPAAQAPVVQADGQNPASTAGQSVAATTEPTAVAKSELKAQYDKMAPQIKQRLLWAMGAEVDPATGQWLMTGSPKSFSEVAAEEQKRTGKAVTRQAVAKSLARFGIGEGQISAAVGTTQQSVTEEDLGITSEQNGSGFRVETTLGKTAGQGLVEDGTTLTKSQASAVAAADKLLAGATPTETADTYEGKRKIAAQAALERDLAEALRHPEAGNAQTDWNDTRFEGSPEFNDLTTSEKLEYLSEYIDQINETGNEWGPVEALVRRLSHDALGAKDRAGQRGGVGEKRADAQLERTGQADSRGSEGGGNPVVVSKAAWTAWADRFPMMPKWDALSQRQRDQVVDLVQRDQFNLASAQTIAGGTTAVNKDVKGPEVPLNRDVLESKSKHDDGQAAGATVAQVEQDLRAFMRVDALGRRVKVVQSIEDLPAGIRADSQTQGIAVNPGSSSRVVYVIADNINPENVRAVFMHEVGAHLGIENMLPSAEFKKLVGQIKTWAKDGSRGVKGREQKLAVAAADRVRRAGVDRADVDSELLAYFIEEAVQAGIDPVASTTRGPISSFFRTLLQYVKAALIKIGFKPETLVAEDIVDLAYGAAHLEITGKSLADRASPTGVKYSRDLATNTPAFKRWFGDSKVVDSAGKPLVVYHGTTADFSAFDPERTGESTDMGFYGKGMYFANDPKAASSYAKRGTWGTAQNQTDGGQVMPVYLSLQKPYITNEEMLDDATLEKIRRDGYDGIISRAAAAQGYVEYVAFRPEQIKSAIGNTGGFSSQNSDIRYSKRALKSGVRQVDVLPDAVSGLLQVAKDGASKLGIRTMFTKDLVALAKAAIPSAQGYMEAMDKIQVERGKLERQIDGILDAFRALPTHLQGTGDGSVNKLIKDMTMSRKWGYKPAWVENATVDADLAARFNALPAPAQDVVRQVFEHGNKTREEMQRAALANIDSEFDGDIAAAKEAGDEKLLARLEAKKQKARSDFTSLFEMGGGWPYAPLKRFGNYVVMGVSQAYKDARAAGDNAKMRELEGDEKHYYVAFAETKLQARAMAADIQQRYAETGHFEKLDQADAWMGGRDVIGAFNRLRTLVKDAADSDVDRSTNARLDHMMRQMYLTLLSENSARKSEINRRNVAGADNDMMRSFATQGRATAHFIAGLKTNGAVTDKLQAMNAEVRSSLADRDQKQAYYNEIMRRHSMTLEYAPSGLIDKAMAGTSVWMLLTNPSYHLINAIQPWVSTIPMLAAKHGYNKSAAELTRAYRDMLPALKDFSLQQEDYSKLPADVRKAVEELANRGVIDISLESQLGRFESAGQGTVRDALTWATTKLRNGSQFIESMNRLSTAVAAFRLEKFKGASDAAAIDYAAKAIYETHGDYSGFNAPRFMRQGIGRLVTQFRKFQLIQISMFARYMNQAMKGATAEERKVGRLALSYSLGHLFAAGGVMGLPGFAAISWILGKVFGDDDEPQDAEATLRRAIGDKDMADLLLKGLPKLAGVDISGRVGAGGMLSILPYTDIEFSRNGYNDIAVGLMGPFLGGLAPRAVDGIDLIGQGQYWKGLEQTLPSGVSNALKATRFATDGVTRRNGDLDLSADEISLLDAAAQAVGLPTNKVSDRSFLSNAKFKADDFYQQKTQDLKRRYVEAVRDGDEAARREAIDDWNAAQNARRRLGLQSQPLSTLLRAPMEQSKRQSTVIGGVQVKPKDQGFLEQLAR